MPERRRFNCAYCYCPEYLKRKELGVVYCNVCPSYLQGSTPMLFPLTKEEETRRLAAFKQAREEYDLLLARINMGEGWIGPTN